MKKGDAVKLRCPVPIATRIGAARRSFAIGTDGVIEEVYPGGQAFEVRLGQHVVTVTRNEIE